MHAVMLTESTSYHRKQKNLWFLPPPLRQGLIMWSWGCWVCLQWPKIRNVRENSCSPRKWRPQDAGSGGQWTMCPCFLDGGKAVSSMPCAKDNGVLLRPCQYPICRTYLPRIPIIPTHILTTFLHFSWWSCKMLSVSSIYSFTTHQPAFLGAPATNAKSADLETTRRKWAHAGHLSLGQRHHDTGGIWADMCEPETDMCEPETATQRKGKQKWRQKGRENVMSSLTRAGVMN